MAIRWDKLTLKSQEAVQKASELAAENGNPELLPIHLLAALLEDTPKVGDLDLADVAEEADGPLDEASDVGVEPLEEELAADPDGQAARVARAGSWHREVADDADFDLDMGEVQLRDLDEVSQTHHDAGVGAEDDFEMGDGTADYSVVGGSGPAFAVEEPPAAPLPDLTAPPSAPAAEAAAPASSSPPIPAVDHSISTAGDVLLDAAMVPAGVLRVN